MSHSGRLLRIIFERASEKARAPPTQRLAAQLAGSPRRAHLANLHNCVSTAAANLARVRVELVAAREKMIANKLGARARPPVPKDTRAASSPNGRINFTALPLLPSGSGHAHVNRLPQTEQSAGSVAQSITQRDKFPLRQTAPASQRAPRQWTGDNAHQWARSGWPQPPRAPLSVSILAPGARRSLSFLIGCLRAHCAHLIGCRWRAPAVRWAANSCRGAPTNPAVRTVSCARHVVAVLA